MTRPAKGADPMNDLLFLALSAAFFAATVGMAFLFEQMREHK